MNIYIHNCPFCSQSYVEIDEFGNPEIGDNEYAVTCPECHAIGPTADDIMGAIAAWNGSASRPAAISEKDTQTL